MRQAERLTSFERFLGLFTRVEPGEGRCIALLCLQAFVLMAAYYLIRPVREALILTEGTAELRSYAVGAQAALLIVLLPAYAALLRRIESRKVFQYVIAIFAANLVVFSVCGQAGLRFSFVFFVWAGIYAVMAVAQFWAFATDLVDVDRGNRIFGVIAVGISAGAWGGASVSSALFDALGPYGLMLLAAATLCGAIFVSVFARRSVPEPPRPHAAVEAPHPAAQSSIAGRWLGGLAQVSRSRYLAGIAVLVVLLNWITSTGDFVLASWLGEVARKEAPQDAASYIGQFMGDYCSLVTLAGFLLQLLVVSRLISFAGLPRALLVTPLAFLGGFLVLGFLPVFALLQTVLVVQRSLDYSLLNTTRSALLLPASRAEKFQGKTAIDTLFYRAGDLLSALGVLIGTRLFGDDRALFIWLIVLLSAAMAIVAWHVGCEYRRRCLPERASSAESGLAGSGQAVVALQ